MTAPAPLDPSTPFAALPRETPRPAVTRQAVPNVARSTDADLDTLWSGIPEKAEDLARLRA